MGHQLLFVVRPDGKLVPVTDSLTPAPDTGDTVVLLSPPVGAPAV